MERRSVGNFTDQTLKNVLIRSAAAPLVAGVIATYLHYDPPPWGTQTGLARAQAIKAYIQSPASSWSVFRWSRIIWNGATSANHDGAADEPKPMDQPDPDTPPSEEETEKLFEEADEEAEKDDPMQIDGRRDLSHIQKLPPRLAAP